MMEEKKCSLCKFYEAEEGKDHGVCTNKGLGYFVHYCNPACKDFKYRRNK